MKLINGRRFSVQQGKAAAIYDVYSPEILAKHCIPVGEQVEFILRRQCQVVYLQSILVF